MEISPWLSEERGRLALGFDLVAVGFVLGLELEVRMGWAKEHFTAIVSVDP